MAIVKKSKDGVQPEKIQGKKSKITEDFSAYGVPEERSTPSEDLSDYTWLLYGEKGIGKTSLAAEMDAGGDEKKVLFVPFEPGGKSLSIYQTPVVTDWAQFLYLIKDLKRKKSKFNTLVIDPGNTAYQRALEYTCKKIGISHPGQAQDFGASWAKVNSEFQEPHIQISAMGLGFIIIAHDKENEIKRRNGSKYNKVAPVLSGATEEFYAGTIDIIAHYHFIGSSRWLRIRGNENVVAKCRPCKRFLTPSGDPIVRIPMGKSPEEGWRYIKYAWENKQENTYSDSEIYPKNT